MMTKRITVYNKIHVTQSHIFYSSDVTMLYRYNKDDNENVM